jgi:hypothetical protein
MFVWLISHQPTILFSHNKSAISNQPAVLFSQNKSAPAISLQPNEQVVYMCVSFRRLFSRGYFILRAHAIRIRLGALEDDRPATGFLKIFFHNFVKKMCTDNFFRYRRRFKRSQGSSAAHHNQSSLGGRRLGT